MLWHSLHSLCIKLLCWVIFAIKTLVVTRFGHQLSYSRLIEWRLLKSWPQLRYFSFTLHKFYGYFSTKLCLEPFGISEVMFTLGTTLDYGTVLWNYKGYKKWCPVMTSLNTGKNYVAKYIAISIRLWIFQIFSHITCIRLIFLRLNSSKGYKHQEANNKPVLSVKITLRYIQSKKEINTWVHCHL